MFLHALVQSSYILDVVGTFWIWSSTNMPGSLLQCWALHAPLTLFDCVTCAIYWPSLYATSQRHDLWQRCNGKAIGALAGRCPTARWLLFEKVSFRATTPAPVTVRAPFSWPIYLPFLFSSSGNCLKKVATDFFESLSTISGDETKSGYVEKHLFLYREIFRKVNLRTLKFCGNLS